jgi:outer membrane protein assembly factor BamB
VGAGALSIGLLGCGSSSEDPRSACKGESDSEGNATGSAALPAPSAVWTHASESSAYFAPRVADLDGDGTLEVLVAGGNEQPSFGELVAMDGTTGFVRWVVGTEAELYTSPVLLDVNSDGVKDVFIGGRQETLLAVDGATGRVLWRFEDTREMPEYYFYNFYTPLLVPDQTGDGLPDLLVTNGGADGIPAKEPRPPGHLLLLSSADGSLLSFAKVPDLQETYMSPVLLPGKDGSAPTILFGTGGETWRGSLWETSLPALISGDLDGARELVSGIGKGMLAPPALADLDGDGQLDIIVATFDGRLMALNGATKAVLWKQSFAGAESFSTPVLGFFDADEIPDVFAVFLHGKFPDYISAERVLVSGRDGSVIWRGAIGDFAMASDVAVDLDGDGLDEVIFNANTLRDPLTARPTEQQLFLVDGACHTARKWGSAPGGFAPGAPWVGDLDGDGFLDLILPRHSPSSGGNDGLITRFRVAAPVPAHVRWGGYFGTDFDSTVQPHD